MTEEDEEMLLKTIQGLVDAHWMSVQTLLRFQRYLEQRKP